MEWMLINVMGTGENPFKIIPNYHRVHFTYLTTVLANHTSISHNFKKHTKNKPKAI